MELAEAQRVIDRVLQLHKSEPYMVPSMEITVAVCSHCRQEDGGRVLMPCPTTAITRKAVQR